MMTNNRRLKFLLMAGLLGAATAVQAGVAREDILFLAQDGHHFTAYKTLRSDLPKRALTLNPGENASDLIYFDPAKYKSEEHSGRTTLSFDGGDYALMRRGSFSDTELKTLNDGSYRFDSWNGEKLPNGHFGKWNSPEPFARFSYAWVVPENISIVKYSANQKGKWTERGDTLVWSGENVNNLGFSITYRVRTTPLAVDVSNVAESGNDNNLTRITVESGSLFPSGSQRFTPAGEHLLSDLAKRLEKRDPAQIIVEGHTDTEPLKPYLRDKYPSNWELSAARATGVVRWLAEHGIDPTILEARAYGSERPVASNDTAQGRAKNRRIEILVKDKPQATQKDAGAPKSVPEEKSN